MRRVMKKPYTPNRTFNPGDKPDVPGQKKYVRTIEKPVPRPDHDYPKSTHKPSPDNDLIYGHHACAAALANSNRKHVHLWATDNALGRLKEDGIEAAINAEMVHPRHLDHLLVGQDAVHQGILLETKPLRQPRLDQIQKDGLIIFLDQVTDPHNVGAILRSAAAFNVAAIISPTRNTAAASGVLFKAASGAYEHVPMVSVTNLGRAIEEVKSLGFQIVGLDSDAELNMDDVKKTRPMALVLGAEGKGLRQQTRSLCDTMAKLSMPGQIKSLNVSVAAALTLYAVTR